jgi:hypothetical protein
MHYPIMNSTSANLINFNGMMNYDQQAQLNYISNSHQPIYSGTNPFLLNSQSQNGFNNHFYNGNHGMENFCIIEFFRI